MFWTGVVSLQSDLVGQSISRTLISPAIIESLNNLNEQGSDEQSTDPVFDPAIFKRTNPAPIKINFELNQDELIKWGVTASKIRTRFNEVRESLD